MLRLHFARAQPPKCPLGGHFANMLGSLKASDYMKALLVAAIVLGSLLMTFGVPAVATFFQSG